MLLSNGYRLVTLTSVFAIAAVNIVGQQSDQTKHEIWPEIEIYIPLKEKYRLIAFANSQKASETGENLEGQFGISIDYAYRENVSFRAGYNFGDSKGTSDRFPEHTIFVEQTIHKSIGEHLLLTDRNRQEMRWLDADFSARFRNRLKLERAFSLGGRSIVPYGSDKGSGGNAAKTRAHETIPPPTHGAIDMSNARRTVSEANRPNRL